jgi:osmotically-inducible protein OsmY
VDPVGATDSSLIAIDQLTRRLKMNDRTAVHEWAFALSLVVASALAGCATFGKCESDSCRDDAQITANIQAQIAQHRNIEPSVDVQTLNHKVYLYGLVASSLEGDTAEEIARATPGVRAVVNSIAVTN